MLMEYRHLTETLQDLHDTNSILLHVVGFIIQFDQEYCLGFDLRNEKPLEFMLSERYIARSP